MQFLSKYLADPQSRVVQVPAARCDGTAGPGRAKAALDRIEALKISDLGGSEWRRTKRKMPALSGLLGDS